MEEKLGNAMTVSDNGLVYNNGYYDSVVTALNTLKEREICTNDSTLSNIVLNENKIKFENKEYRLYTEDSYSALKQVISNINTGLKANDQQLIEQMATDITNAYEALVFEDADYEALDTIINNFRSSNGYVNDLYTEDSKQAVENVIEEINNNRPLKINNQQVLIDYRNTLNEKINALEYKAARGYDATDNYKTDEGYKSVSEYNTLFQEEINKENYDKLYNDEGKELLENYVSIFNNQSNDNMNIKINNQSKMDKFLKDIKDLFDNLRDYKNNASYKELDDVLTDLDKTLYTNESWTAFETSEIYNEATGVKINRPYKYDEQDEVDEIVSRLNQAIEQLDYKPAAYEELDKIIDKINNNYKNDKDLYKNYDSIEEILQRVNKNYKIIDQQKVDDLVEELKEAIVNLELKDASYEELKDVVSKLPKNYSNYDSDLKKKIDNVLRKLSELPSDLKITKQNKIDELVKEINDVLNDIKQSPKSSDVQKNIIENKEVTSNSANGGNNFTKGNNAKVNEQPNTEENLKIVKYIKINGKKIDLNSEKLKCDVAYDVDRADVEVGLYSNNYSAKVYGGEKILLGDNLVRIVVTDKKGSVYEYNVTINRKETSSYLTKLEVKEGKLDFNKKTLKYDIKVKNKVKRLTISYELEDKNAKVKIVGNDNIKSGDEVKIIITSSNKDTKTYVLNVNKTKNYLPLVGLIIIICLIPIYIIKRRK